MKKDYGARQFPDEDLRSSKVREAHQTRYSTYNSQQLILGAEKEVELTSNSAILFQNQVHNTPLNCMRLSDEILLSAKGQNISHETAVPVPPVPYSRFVIFPFVCEIQLQGPHPNETLSRRLLLTTHYPKNSL